MMFCYCKADSTDIESGMLLARRYQMHYCVMVVLCPVEEDGDCVVPCKVAEGVGCAWVTVE